MRVEDLHLFLVVAREGTLTGAAEVMHRAQQSISQRIVGMERKLGAVLFERSSRGMSLTPAGARLVPYAKECIELLGEAARSVGAEGAGDPFRVALHRSSAAVAKPWLAEVLDGFEVKFSEQSGGLPDLLEAVAAGEVDIATGPFNRVPEGVVAEVFALDPVACVVAPDSPLAGSGEVTLADLDGVVAAVSVWGASEQHLLQLPRLDPADEPGAARPVAGGRRHELQVRPRSSVMDDLAAGDLAEVVVSDLPVWSRELKVAYRATDGFSAAVQAVRVMLPVWPTVDDGKGPAPAR